MTTAGKVNLSLVAAAAGAYLPWKMGLIFLDPLVIIPYAVLSLFCASAMLPMAPRRVGLAGAGYAALLIGLGIGMVNAGFWHGTLLLPAPLALLAALVLAFSVCLFAGAWALRYISKNNTAQEAAQRVRWTALLLILFWTLRSSVLPSSVRELVAGFTTTGGLATMAFVISAALVIAARWAGRPVVN